MKLTTRMQRWGLPGLLSLLLAAVLVLPQVIGVSAWSGDSTVNTPICTYTNDQITPQITSDGAGGAIITWQDYGSGTDWDIYVQRANDSGYPQWISDGVSMCNASGDQTSPQITSDGAGGAIITWQDKRNGNKDIYAQRVNSTGAALWANNGAPICTSSGNQELPQITSDGASGAIITWDDYADIYAQRINASGIVQWTDNGSVVCNVSYTQGNPRITSDGTGGAIITWQDNRNGGKDIYAQRVNSTGAALWVGNGSVVCNVSGNQMNEQITSDGANGAIINWEDYRNGSGAAKDIYAQRINASGVIQWDANAVAICGASGEQRSPQLTSDGTGGAILTWSDYRSASTYDVYAQRVNSSGAVQWDADGVVVGNASNNQELPQLISNGAGGAIITWVDDRDSYEVYDIYAQKFNNIGVPQWDANGVVVSNASDSQNFPQIISDSASGAIITWQDYRSGSDWDIYAQWVNPNGSFSDTYTLNTSSSDGGNVSIPGELGPYTYPSGNVTSIVATNDSCYHFVNWSGDVDSIGDVNASSTTIHMSDNYSVMANFAINTYNLSTSSTDGGNVSNPGEAGPYAYNCSEIVTINATPDPGYHFVNWSGTGVDAGEVANTSLASTTINMSNNYAVQANFATNGPAAQVDLGSVCNFAILAYAGISDVPTSAITGDIGVTPTTGTSIGVTCPEMLTGTVYDVDGAYTHAACLVTNSSLLGTAMNDMNTAYTDANSRATDVLNAGDGAGDIGGLTLVPGVYTFTGGSINVQISTDLVLNGNADGVWIFQIPGTFDVHANVSLTGGAQAKNIVWAVAGQTTIFPGFTVYGNILDQTSIAMQSLATLNGRAVALTGSVTLIANTVTAASCTCTQTFTLNTSSTTGGDVTTPGEGSPIGTYNCSEVVNIVATNNSCYHFVNWSGDIGTIDYPNASSANITVSSNYSVQANFAINTYNLSTSSTVGGNVTIPGEAGPYTYNCSQIVTINATPATCYHFVNWTGNTSALTGAATSASNSVNMSANVSLTANFAINTYTLTYVAGTGGSITGNASQTVNCSANGSAVTAVANACYMFTGWSDSVATATRTALNVTSNLTVTANFASICGGVGGGYSSTISILDGTVIASTGGNGVLLQDVNASSQDGNASIHIASGTAMLDKNGNPLTYIDINPVSSYPTPPAGITVIAAFDFQPSGATFNPAIEITLTYDPALLPAGASESQLVIAFYSEATGQWVYVSGTVNPGTNTITFSINHFTIFAIMSQQASSAAPAATATPTPTATVAPTATPIVSPTPAATATATPTATSTATPTPKATVTPTATPTATPTGTANSNGEDNGIDTWVWIVIAIAGGILLVGLVGAIVIRKRKQQPAGDE